MTIAYYIDIAITLKLDSYWQNSNIFKDIIFSHNEHQ